MKKKKILKLLIEYVWATQGYIPYEENNNYIYTYCTYCGKLSPIPEKGDGKPIKHTKKCVVRLVEKLRKK